MDILTGLAELVDRCQLPRHRDQLQLISLRGAKVVQGKLALVENRIDYFNDTLFTVNFHDGFIRSFRCTAGEPGWYWINHPDYRGPKRGAPFTCPGQYSYVRGLHRGHPALRQEQTEAGRLKVIRDVNKNGQLDRRDLVERPLTTGINIHAAGHRKETIGAASSGCHVLFGRWEDTEWTTFYRIISTVYSQTRYPYSVLEGSWYADGLRRMLLGSEGESVTRLQKLLIGKGYDLKADGHFGHHTDQRVMAWQLANGGLPTGIVTNASRWAAETLFGQG
jgi:hypothetical protein